MKYRIPRPNPNPTPHEILPLYGLDPDVAHDMSERVKWELDNAEYFTFVFKPKDEQILNNFIPPQLKLSPGMPLISMFVQQLTLNGGRDNDSLNYGYLENIIAAFVSYNGQMGMYPIAIHIESDIGAMLGREMFGTAKKCGQFDFQRNGDKFFWKMTRRGITIAEAGGEITDADLDPESVYKLIQNPTFHLQQTVGTLQGGQYYAYPPRLVKINMGIRKVHKLKACDNVELVFHESPFDPICLLQPEEILAVTYLNADTEIVPGTLETLEDTDPEQMLPFLFSKLDPF
jgi:acetoacetate decarboxylase